MRVRRKTANSNKLSHHLNLQSASPAASAWHPKTVRGLAPSSCNYVPPCPAAERPKSAAARHDASPSPLGREVGVRVRRQTANSNKAQPSPELAVGLTGRFRLASQNSAQPCTVILQLRATLSHRRTTEVCCCPTRRKPLSPGRGVGARVRRQTANPDKLSHHLNLQSASPAASAWHPRTVRSLAPSSCNYVPPCPAAERPKSAAARHDASPSPLGRGVGVRVRPIPLAAISPPDTLSRVPSLYRPTFLCDCFIRIYSQPSASAGNRKVAVRSGARPRTKVIRRPAMPPGDAPRSGLCGVRHAPGPVVVRVDRRAVHQRLGGVNPGRIAGQLAPRSLADPSGRRTRHAGRRGMRVGSTGNRCPCLRSTDQALRWSRLPARSGESPTPGRPNR